MTTTSKLGQEYFGDIAPAFADYVDRVLLEDVWQQTGLTEREKHFAAISSATTLGQADELLFHFKAALDSGIQSEDLTALLTHLAFYAGFPATAKAVAILRQVRGASR